MRNVSKIVGIGLMTLALASTAHAQGPGAPGADAARPPTPVAAPAAPAVEAAPPVAAPAAVVAYTPPPEVDPDQRRLDVQLSFLPMGRGKLDTAIGGMQKPGDAAFAYGFVLSANYRLIRGLSVGLAPQAVWNVKYKTYPSSLAAPGADTEYDLMLRVAYTHRLVETISVYGEVLPGYSIIKQPNSSTVPAGLVLALGAGISMDMGPRAFINVGGGYQFGFQKVSVSGTSFDNTTRYIRFTLGGGYRF